MLNKYYELNNFLFEAKSSKNFEAINEFNTQKQTVYYGKDIAKKQKTELVVYDKISQIREKNINKQHKIKI